MTVRQRLVVGSLIAGNLAVAACVIASGYKSRSTVSAVAPNVVRKPQSLPIAKLRDDAGNEVDTRSLIGSPVFVQFVNPYIDAQVDAYLRVRRHEVNRSISWLLISRDAGELRVRLPHDNDDFIVDGDYDSLRELFGVPRCCEEWLIFDSSGALKDAGRYDEGNTPSHLKQAVGGQAPYSAGLLFEVLESLNHNGDLEQIHARAAASRSRKAVAALFSSACMGCPEDDLISLLISRSESSPNVAFMALLPGTHSRSDIENFKTNLDIPFAVEPAGPALSTQWLLLNEQYGWKPINGTVIVAERGRVVSIANGIRETERLLEGLEQ